MVHEESGRKYDIQDRLIEFAGMALEVAESLPNTFAGKHIGGQLIRCGTSPAANYGEARAAESRKDFVHKMKLCLKELRETDVWLAIMERRKMSQNPNRIQPVLAECNELISIFVKSIHTAKTNNEKMTSSS